jgi:hypothetical protein
MPRDIHSFEFNKTRSNSNLFEVRRFSLYGLHKSEGLLRTNASKGSVELRRHVEEEVYEKRLNPHIDNKLFSCQSFEFLNATAVTWN